MNSELTDILQSGERARLIPVVADSRKEQRATSALLAVFSAVPDFARAMLADVGAPASRRITVDCYTEVVFKSKSDKPSKRPDGLVVVRRGKSSWTALIEAKTGTATLNQDQCEAYLDLAKEVGVDAVITISNQYSTLPSHHPISISRKKTKKVGLFHFSWMSLVSKAILISESKVLEDREQRLLLSELVRYLQHESSGVTSFTKMGRGWRDLSVDVQQGVSLKRTDPHLLDAVASWGQLVRYLAIDLTMALGRPVQVALSRAHAADPTARLNSDIERILSDLVIASDFDIPNAATKLSMTADFRRRTINYGMELQAPQDKARPSTAISWLTRQLRHLENPDLLVRVDWPRRISTTICPLDEAIDDPNCLIPDGTKELPKTLAITKVVDLAGKFSASSSVVDLAREGLLDFYHQVGESLQAWVPEPPKLKEPDEKLDVLPAIENISLEVSEKSIEISSKEEPSQLSAERTEGLQGPE